MTMNMSKIKMAILYGGLVMNETVKIWLVELYSKEIVEIKGTISNERIWELGYEGEEPNPHTENIEVLKEYLEVLEGKLEELK